MKIDKIVGKVVRKNLNEMASIENPFNSAIIELNERNISIDNEVLLKTYGLLSVTLSKKNNYVTLTDFVVKERNGGYGTRFMEDLTMIADKQRWTLVLTPDTAFGATSVARLKRFYNRFGFKDNKGRNADFGTRESMIRRPVK